jgi:hypothetical protein
LPVNPFLGNFTAIKSGIKKSISYFCNEVLVNPENETLPGTID